MSFYLNRIKIQSGSNKMVLSVPTYANSRERQALMDSAMIADIDCLDILNNHIAIAKAYSFSKSKEIHKSVDVWKTVCFIDFGLSSLSICLVEYGPSNGKVLYTASDRKIGTRNIDLNLMKYFADKFKEEFGGDPS